MKDIIAAIMLAASTLTGTQPADDPSTPVLNEIANSIKEYGVSVGYCSTADLRYATRFIAFGAFTRIPENSDGFVNIGNTWCGLRDTGERVDCPAPITEQECHGKDKP